MKAVIEAEAVSTIQGHTHYPVKPTGYRLLVRLPEKQDKVAGTSLYAPQERRDIDHRFVPIVQVLKLGPSAYQDIEKFPDGPWCQEGDWVQIGSLEGHPFKLQGFGNQEFRFINDDQVLAIADGPGSVGRV
jgi:hypothetical protein